MATTIDNVAVVASATASAPVPVAVKQAWDIFFSYEPQIEKKIAKLYETLRLKFDLSICFLDTKSKVTSDSQIMKSSIVVCCLTKAYTTAKKCQNEIAIAYTNDKPILVLMCEKLNNQDLASIAFALSNIRKFNLYDDAKILDTWDGSLFDLIIESIEDILKRKLKKSREETREVAPRRKSIKPVSTAGRVFMKTTPRLISSTAYNTEKERNNKDAGVPTATIVSFEAEEYGLSQKTICQYDEFYEPESVNLLRIKSSTFLEFSYGYNRMVYIESRQRYLLTSSLHKTIISIDSAGNWIERRNPGGLLKQPFSICASDKDEIFVGDNILKAILVFDVNLKHLRTFKEILNGFFDMTIDNDTNELYAVYLYDSLIAIVDTKSGKMKRKIAISTPAYVRVTVNQIFVISSSDLIYVINKTSLEVNYTIKIKNSKFVNGLFVDKHQNVFTTAHYIDDTATSTPTASDESAHSSSEEENKENEVENKQRVEAVAAAAEKRTKETKEVYLCYIVLKEDIWVKRVNLGLTQANDLVVFGDKHMAFVSDTHLDQFTFNGFPMNNNNNVANRV